MLQGLKRGAFITFAGVTNFASAEPNIAFGAAACLLAFAPPVPLPGGENLFAGARVCACVCV